MAKKDFDTVEVRGEKMVGVTTIDSSMLDYIAIQGLKPEEAEKLKADYLASGYATHGTASWGEPKKS